MKIFNFFKYGLACEVVCSEMRANGCYMHMRRSWFLARVVDKYQSIVNRACDSDRYMCTIF